MLTAKNLKLTLERIYENSRDHDALRNYKVSKKSGIFDLVWDFSLDRKHLPRSIGRAKTNIQWEKYNFSESLRKELQIIFFVYYKSPNVFSRRPNIKPNSLCITIRACLDFLDRTLSNMPSSDLIQTISQFEISDLKKQARLQKQWRPSVINYGLKIIFSERTESILNIKLKINEEDIRRLEYPRSKQTSRNISYIPDELFSLLSENATARVSDFLTRMGKTPNDKISSKFNPDIEILKIEDFVATFSLFENYCVTKPGVSKVGNSGGYSSTHYYFELKKSGVSLKALRDYINEINCSAHCVIALYIGARLSELVSIKENCVTEKDGVPCIFGRLYKTKSDSRVDDDAWIAIPAVLDAVSALEMMAKFKNKKYLISSTNTNNKNDSRYNSSTYDIGLAGGSLANEFRKFLHKIDLEGKFAGWKFNLLQFRHSLARQMVKANLGLPYISFHMKHLHSKVTTLPSHVTLGYGNAGNLIQSKLAGTYLDDLRLDITRKLFDPKSVVLGGASKEFDERRKAYFVGMSAAGYTHDKIIEELAKTATPQLVNVGLGYCAGRKQDPTNINQPPCIGSLRCNPSKCSNAIITSDHIPAWKAVMDNNQERLNDPRFSYAKAECQAAVDEARLVLLELDSCKND